MYAVRVLSEAGTEVRNVVRAGTPTHSRLRGRLVAIALATVGFDLICAVLAFLLEHDQKQTQIKTFGSALFWTTTQLLTVSSSVQNPISFSGSRLTPDSGVLRPRDRAIPARCLRLMAWGRGGGRRGPRSARW
jgi:hypothetical protein